MPGHRDERQTVCVCERQRECVYACQREWEKKVEEKVKVEMDVNVIKMDRLQDLRIKFHSQTPFFQLFFFLNAKSV